MLQLTAFHLLGSDDICKQSLT